MAYPTAIRDALANLCDDSGASDDYKRGVIIGLVSALMYRGASFESALAELVDACVESERLEPDLLVKYSPATWRESIRAPHFLRNSR